jgi:hypothetical protein
LPGSELAGRQHLPCERPRPLLFPSHAPGWQRPNSNRVVTFYF